jgi:hypothetical protein
MQCLPKLAKHVVAPIINFANLVKLTFAQVFNIFQKYVPVELALVKLTHELPKLNLKSHFGNLYQNISLNWSPCEL